MKRLARWCVVHRRLVVLIWIAVLLATFAANRNVGTAFATKFQLPNTESARALDLLRSEFPAASGTTDQIVFHAASGVTEPAVQDRAEQMLAKVVGLPHVSAVVSPFSPAGAHQISKDGTVAFATVKFDVESQSLSTADVKKFIETAQAAEDPQLEVALVGQDIEHAQSDGGSSSTLLGVILALVVLGIAFGSLFAAFLPLITALVAIGVGFSLTGLLTHVFSIASFATLLGVLIGLGVGVDYALLIVTRHRAGIKAGQSIEESAVSAINTAGRSVFFAGLTVCIALLGQFALGVSFLYGIAVSAALTVLLTMVTSLTLLPALLGFFGTKVFSRRQRARMRVSGPVAEDSGGFWLRWAQFIERHPIGPTLTALVVVTAIAAPILTLRLGLDDAGSDPSSSTTYQGYQYLEEGFGPGFSGPFELVAALPAPGDVEKFTSIVDKLADEPGVAQVTDTAVSPNQKVAIASLYPTTSPQSRQTAALLHHLRGTAIPQAAQGSGLDILVGGPTAIQTDFSRVLSAKLPLFIGVVVLLGFLLLMAVFRSLLVPLVASAMNLLSVGAALGLLNMVFEWGWGKSLFDISATAPVEVFVPVLMISILFGLSMDYEVFLVSRIHEEWVRTRDNRRAVTIGQATTGRVITAAAMIMILVFASFALGPNVVIKQFGIGLAGAIFIDAFIVRTFIVPGLMHVFGEANWWLPRWLDRIIPNLNIEGDDLAKPEPELVTAGQS
ncbi:MAG TPA: MMPL family transporter [Mycobacteriales bacterium]|nr:MMPL family transporter [Mycobacteriales bacterium]